LYTLNIPSATDFQAYTVNDYIYSYTDDGSNNFELIHSWFSDYIFSLSNPVTSRFQSARPTFSTIPFVPTVMSSFNDFNPYLVLIGINGRNASGMMHFFRSMSEFSKTNFNAGLTIFSITESSTSSGSIATHLISGPALPTWRLTTARKAKPPTAAIPATSTFTQVDLLSKQDDMKFLVQPDLSGTPTTIPYPAKVDPMVPATAEMYILNSATAASTDPKKILENNPVKFISFNEYKHYTPDMLIYNPFSVTASALFTTTIAGLIIENGNVDGFATHLPNPDLPTPFNNAHLASSSVSVHDTMLPVFFGTTDHATSVSARAFFSWPKQPVVTLLNDITQVHLPRTTGTVFGHTHVHSVGLNPSGRFSMPFSAFSFLGRTIQATAQHAPSNKVERRRAYLWSSYRILEDEQHAFQIAQFSLTASERIGQLSSLKHLFGSRSLVGSIPHPSTFIH
jgi:hypothetical protein